MSTTLRPGFRQDDEWIYELYNFIRSAKDRGKCLREKLQGTTFTPDALVAEILNGHFRWGIVNWEEIAPPAKCDYDLSSAASAVRPNLENA